MNKVTISYLEMNNPSDLNEKAKIKALGIVRCEIKQFKLNKFLYAFIGSGWNWTDKLSWSDEKWKNYVEDDSLITWIAYCKGAIAGYYELSAQEDGNVEIAYFGLAPEFIGKGIGGYLLTHAIQSAWALTDTKRVWVHTCSLDHPNALKNYLSRGMKIYKEETK